MTAGWFRSLVRDGPWDLAGAKSFYECTNCESVYDDWPGSCPRCDQLVVRVVDRVPRSPR